MTAALLPNGKQQFLDANGDPLAAGLVYFYIPTTTDFKDTWKDEGQTTLNTNPVQLDAGGRAVIWGSGDYRQVVYDAFGNLIWDQITSGNVSQASSPVLDEQIMIGAIPIFKSKVAAELFHPVSAPDFIGLSGYYASGDAGNTFANFKKVVPSVDPGIDASIDLVLADGVTHQWYVVADKGTDTRDYGILADGTEQTAELVAMFTALGAAGFRGVITIPYNTAFTIHTVYAAVPVGIQVQDNSSKNWHYSASYKNKITNFYSSDVVSDDSATMVSSSYHAVFMLNNFGTGEGNPSDSAAGRFCSIAYAAGQEPYGEYAIGFFEQVAGLTDPNDPTKKIWNKTLYLEMPFEWATKAIAWKAATAFAVGDIVITPTLAYVYQCTVAGVSGATEPTFTSGTGTDGTVTWQFLALSPTVGAGISQINEHGNTLTVSLQSVHTDQISVKNTSLNLVKQLDSAFGQYSFMMDVPGSGVIGGLYNFGHNGAKVDLTSPGISLVSNIGVERSLCITSETANPVTMVIVGQGLANWTPMRVYTGTNVVGELQATTSGFSLASISDSRVKKDVEPIANFSLGKEEFANLPNSVLKILSLNPVVFRYIWDKDDVPVLPGLIADEVYKVFPHLVSGTPGEMEDVGTATVPGHWVEGQMYSTLTGERLQHPPTWEEERKVERVTEKEAPLGSTWEKTGEREKHMGINKAGLVDPLILAFSDLAVAYAKLETRVQGLEDKLSKVE